MKVMREAVRKHIDVTHTAKEMAEVLLGWLARCEAWARQVDEYFEYKVFDKKLSLAANKKRFAEYTKLQEALHTASISTIEQILNCYGVGKGGMDLLAQLMVASKLQGQANARAYETILAGLSGVGPLDAKTMGGGVAEPANCHSQDPYDNPTLKLIMGSFLEKAAVYKMPQPDVHIDGVPDEDDQASPREHIKKAVSDMLLDGESKKIQ